MVLEFFQSPSFLQRFGLIHLNMARKDVQETAEYYRWLIRIERQKFEELLEIVSIKNL